MLKKSVSVVIPAFNESGRLPQTLRDVHAWLQNSVEHFEIIIVDDGSTDDTREVVVNLARQLSNIILITNPRNRGKGAVVRQGLRQASGEIICYMDADHSTHIKELLPAADLIAHGADVAVGSRYLAGSRIMRRQPSHRVLVSRLANLFIRAWLVPGILDTQNGFKVFIRLAIKKTLPYLSVNGWAFDVELLFVSRRLGQKIVEFPVTWQNDKASRLRVIKAVLGGCRELTHIMIRRIQGGYPRLKK